MVAYATHFIPCCLKFCKVLALCFHLILDCGVLVFSVETKRSDHVTSSPETKGDLMSVILRPWDYGR